MTAQDHKKPILVNSNPEAVFAAVTDGVQNWWTRPDQPLRKVGYCAKFPFPPGKSYWTFKLTTAETPVFVEWTCVGALHIHEGRPKEIETEWLGTTVRWTIDQTPQCTKVTIEHAGLNPGLLCYDICEAGWDMFFLGSLRSHLETGQVTPHIGV